MIPLKAMLTPDGQLEGLEAISFCPIPHSNAAKITDRTADPDTVVIRKELEPLEAPRPARGRGRGRARWQGPEDGGPVAQQPIEKLRYLGGEASGFGDVPFFSSAWTKVEKTGPIPEEGGTSRDDSFASWLPDSAASMAAKKGNAGRDVAVAAVPPPISGIPRTKKNKANGYVLFLQSMKRKNGDVDGNVDALINKYDSEWQKLPEERKAFWRDKGRAVRNVAESASASTSTFTRGQAPYGGGRNDFDSSTAASVTTATADDDDDF